MKASSRITRHSVLWYKKRKKSKMHWESSILWCVKVFNIVLLGSAMCSIACKGKQNKQTYLWIEFWCLIWYPVVFRSLKDGLSLRNTKILLFCLFYPAHGSASLLLAAFQTGGRWMVSLRCWSEISPPCHVMVKVWFLIGASVLECDRTACAKSMNHTPTTCSASCSSLWVFALLIRWSVKRRARYDHVSPQMKFSLHNPGMDQPQCWYWPVGCSVHTGTWQRGFWNLDETYSVNCFMLCDKAINLYSIMSVIFFWSFSSVEITMGGSAFKTLTQLEWKLTAKAARFHNDDTNISNNNK